MTCSSTFPPRPRLGTLSAPDRCNGLLGAFSGDCDFNVRARLDCINLRNNYREMTLDTRPTRGQQDDYRQLSIRQALLVAKVLVSCHQRVETRSLGLTQQLAVLQLAPTQFVGGSDVMFSEMCPQRDRRALVKEDTHLRNLQRVGSVLQDHTRLFNGDARKPAHEIRELSPIFEILE